MIQKSQEPAGKHYLFVASIHPFIHHQHKGIKLAFGTIRHDTTRDGKTSRFFLARMNETWSSKVDSRMCPTTTGDENSRKHDAHDNDDALEALSNLLSILPEQRDQIFDKNSIQLDEHGRVVKLRFKRNQILSSLPPDIATHLSHLQVLSLYGCTKLQCIPPEIGQLSNLRELDLRACKLSRLSPRLGGALTNKLEILDISFSKDLICIPREVLDVMRKLRKLSMARCSWLNAEYLLIQGIRQSDSLEYLNINFNDIKPKDYEELLTTLPSHFPRLMVLNACPDYRSTSSKEYIETIAPRIAQFEDQNTVRYLFLANKKTDGNTKPTTIPPSLWPLVFEKMNKRHSDRPHRAMNVIYPLLRNGPALAFREASGLRL
jgi:hypothetical protein